MRSKVCFGERGLQCQHQERAASGTLGVVFAFAYFTAEGARMGDVTLAANAVLLNFQMFMAHGLDGFAHAAEALVGKAVGEKDRAALQRSVVLALRWSLIVAAGSAVRNETPK